jgi:hypothetical protein
METPNLNPSRNIEKFKTAEVNLIVKGALSKFKGFGENIASYYDKEKFRNEYQSILKTIEDYDRKLSSGDDNKQKASSGFLEYKNGLLFFGEDYRRYTNFPEQNRFYRQTIYSFLDEKDPNIENAGKIFSSLKPFKQYSEESFGQNKFEVEFKKEQPILSTRLKEYIEQVLFSEQGQKLIIKAPIGDDQDLLGEKALQFAPVKSVLSAHDVINTNLRSKFSFYFGNGDNIPINAKIWVLFDNLNKDSEDYYKKQGSIVIDWSEETN